MRNGQNKRMRGRNNNNNNRKSSNPLTRVYESNGPDVKIRGTASHVAEKYIQLARDSQASGDPVAAENYYQHAEHYFRMIAAAQEQFRQGQQPPFQRPPEGGEQRDDSFEGDDEFQGQGEPGYVTREPQAPYPALSESRPAKSAAALSARPAAAASAAAGRRPERYRRPAVFHHGRRAARTGRQQLRPERL
jgi:hypothetical protein